MGVPAYVADIVLALLSGGVGLYVGRELQRRNEMARRLGETEDRIWKLARISEEYWNLDLKEEERIHREISMKILSVRIANDIKRLKLYSHSDFDSNSRLTALRRSAMGSPFEETGKLPDPRRGDLIRQRADELVHELSVVPRNFWEKLWRRHIRR